MPSVELKDFSMFYEKSGAGEPLILLHGNGESSKIFKEATTKLNKHFSVYAPDSRNHGKSKCKVINYNYIQMANDIYEFILKKGLKKVHIYGFSDGGIIALILTLKHPEITKSLILSGVNLNPKGLKLSSRISMFLTYLFDNDENTRKLNKLMLKNPHINPQKLSEIKCKTMLTIGKKDVIKRKHSYLIKESIPNCKLIIVKNGNHHNYIVDNTLIADLIIKFIKNK